MRRLASLVTSNHGRRQRPWVAAAAPKANPAHRQVRGVRQQVGHVAVPGVLGWVNTIYESGGGTHWAPATGNKCGAKTARCRRPPTLPYKHLRTSALAKEHRASPAPFPEYNHREFFRKPS